MAGALPSFLIPTGSHRETARKHWAVCSHELTGSSAHLPPCRAHQGTKTQDRGTASLYVTVNYILEEVNHGALSLSATKSAML